MAGRSFSSTCLGHRLLLVLAPEIIHQPQLSSSSQLMRISASFRRMLACHVVSHVACSTYIVLLWGFSLSRSSTVQLYNLDSAINLSARGIASPDSHIDTVVLDILRCIATCACVKFADIRACLKLIASPFVNNLDIIIADCPCFVNNLDYYFSFFIECQLY